MITTPKKPVGKPPDDDEYPVHRAPKTPRNPLNSKESPQGVGDLIFPKMTLNHGSDHGRRQ